VKFILSLSIRRARPLSSVPSVCDRPVPLFAEMGVARHLIVVHRAAAAFYNLNAARLFFPQFRFR
jgi:hypothetical protein